MLHRQFDPAYFVVEDGSGQRASRLHRHAVRALHSDARVYTFWKYLRNAYARDAGLRIDHILLSPAAARHLQSAGVDRDVRGWEHSSDHAPAWVRLEGAALGPRK